MALTQSDKQDLRVMIREEVRSVVATELEPIHEKLDSMEGRIKALENDIHDIYLMLGKRDVGDPSFNNLTLEQKIRTTYEQLKITAKEAGIKL